MSGAKERPILFSGEMVRAILAGRKTQTRRIARGVFEYDGAFEWRGHRWGALTGAPAAAPTSPYGAPGDRLWVRETWAGDDLCGFVYRADHPDADLRAGDLDDGEQEIRAWRSPRFMPRCASRVTLDVVAVRVERLQEISEQEARAEGAALARIQESRPDAQGPILAGFANLWDHINGKRAPWASNPWVWVVDFEKLADG